MANFLTEKAGPIPTWAWIAGGTAGVLFYVYKQKKSSSSAQTANQDNAATLAAQQAAAAAVAAASTPNTNYGSGGQPYYGNGSRGGSRGNRNATSNYSTAPAASTTAPATTASTTGTGTTTAPATTSTGTSTSTPGTSTGTYKTGVDAQITLGQNATEALYYQFPSDADMQGFIAATGVANPIVDANGGTPTVAQVLAAAAQFNATQISSI
jgi:hypothetical protein